MKLCWHHDDVIKWKHFPRNWPFVREIHRSPVNCPHKGQWRGALMFSLIYAWINDCVNNREAGDLRCQHDHYDVIVMILLIGCLGTNISELGIEIETFPFAKQAYESVVNEMAAILFLHQSIILWYKDHNELTLLHVSTHRLYAVTKISHRCNLKAVWL